MTATPAVAEPHPRTAADPPPPRARRTDLLRWEAARLLRHPATLVGLGLSLLWAFATQLVPAPYATDLVALGVRLPGTVLPLAVGGFLAAHAAAGRPLRTDCDGLVDAMPTSRTQRVTVALGAVGVLVVLAGVVVVTRVVLADVLAIGTAGSLPVGSVLTALVLPAAAGSGGVALAVRRPSTRAAVLWLAGLAVLAMALWLGPPLALFLLLGDDEPTSGLVRVLDASDLLLLPDWQANALFVTSPTWLQTAFVAGLTALLVAGALATVRPVRRHTVAVGLAAAAVVASVGAIQLHDVSLGDYDELVAAAAAPDRTCVDTELATACMLEDYVGTAAWVDELAGSVVAPIPPAARPRLRFDQQVLYDDPNPVFVLDGEEVEGLDEALAQGRGRPSGDAVPFELPLPFGGSNIWLSDLASHADGIRGEFFFLLPELRTQVRIGAAVAGIPRGATGGPPEPAQQCTTAGQAREVVGLWLAGRILDGPLLTDALAGEVEVLSGEFDSVPGPLPDLLVAGPAVLSPDGVALAGQLLALPDDRVADVVTERFATWTDPATPASELADAFDLDPVGATWQHDSVDLAALPACS